MNVFGFEYLIVLKDLFLMICWGLFMGCTFGLIFYFLFDWLQKGGEDE